MPPDRPNVLQILTDQQQAVALGAVDDGYSTPNIDGLADEGTRFTHCYCTSPQCSPSRSSLVTGRFPHQTGVYANSPWGPYDLDLDATTVGHVLGGVGYDAVWSGKWHLGGGGPDSFGWRDLTPSEAEVVDPETPDTVDADRQATEAATRYLSRYEGPEPFFLTVAYELPHPTFYEDEGFADRYSRGDVDLPKSFDDDLADKPAFHVERANMGESDQTAEEYRDIRYRYRTMVSRVDDYIGRVLDELKDRGLREDTAVLFASDHGDMQGAHGMNKKGTLAYEELLRVPLIVDVPSFESERQVVDDLVSTAAVPGTLVEAAGLDVPGTFEGGSLFAAMERMDPPDNERVFFEHKCAYWGHYPYRGVRTRDWKFVDYLDEPETELYDMVTDPHEMQNLAGDSESEDVRARLREMVEGFWEETDGDVDHWRTTPAP